MKHFIKAILLSFILLSAFTNAHPDGHGKPQIMYKEQAIATAKHHIYRLIKSGDLDQSWGTIKASSAILERRESRMEWIVSFSNQGQVEGKGTLFIFLSNTGFFISNNFTGK